MINLITMTGLPIPHSINAQFTRSGTSNTIIKTREARLYDADIELWGWRHKKELDQGRLIIESWLAVGDMIGIEIELYWPASKLLTKQMKPKRLDSNNRIKKVIDGVSHLLNFDDCHIGKESCTKIPVALPSFEEKGLATVRLKPLPSLQATMIKAKADGPHHLKLGICFQSTDPANSLSEPSELKETWDQGLK